MEMKKILALALAFVFITGVFCELRAEWVSRLTADTFRGVQSIKKTNDGGCIILGSGNGTGSDYWLVKMSDDGKVEWQKRYGLTDSTGNKLEEIPQTVLQTNDGGYIITGNSRRQNTWIVKVNNIGNIEWQKISTYWANWLTGADGTEMIKQLSDGSYLVADHAMISGCCGSDFHLMKLNQDGSFAGRLGIPIGNYQKLRSVDFTKDGGIILAGTFQEPDAKLRFWIVKLNSDYTIAWQKKIKTTVSGASEDFPMAITTSDGGFIIGGHVVDVWGSPIYGSPRSLIIKMDPNGQVLWKKVLSCKKTNSIKDMKATPDGGFVLVGITNPTDQLGTEKAWIVKLNSEGAIIWDKIYGQGMGLRSVDLTNDGGYLVAGSQYTSAPFTDPIIMKLDSNGTIPGCSLLKEEGITSSIEINLEIQNTTYNLSNNQTSSITDTFITPQSTSIAQTYTCFVSNHIPYGNAGIDLIITSQDKNNTVINGYASDEDSGDQLQYRWWENNIVIQNWLAVGSHGECPLTLSSINFSPGSYVLKLEVSDGEATNSDEMNLVIGNTAPYVALSGGGVFEFNSDVYLNATISDYDGDLINYKWTDGLTTFCSGTIQTIAGGSPVSLPACKVNNLTIGANIIVLEVSDGVNEVSGDTQVDIVDTTAPKLAPVINTNMLWPPNHKMVDIVIKVNAVDNTGGSIILSAEVRSNEPEDGLGDGDTAPDWTGVDINQETGIMKLQLRAERGGGGNGREYTITITAMDSSGNKSMTDLKVVVPHDKRTK
jgi:hypothetical protein